MPKSALAPAIDPGDARAERQRAVADARRALVLDAARAAFEDGRWARKAPAARKRILLRGQLDLLADGTIRPQLPRC